ncbi:MAG: helix-turn-helix domain-containing protein [Propionicimonas sp.]
MGEDIIELGRPDNRRAEDVGDLAERLAVSERTLQRLARHYIGVSPAALLRHRRLQAAADGYAVGPC